MHYPVINSLANMNGLKRGIRVVVMNQCLSFFLHAMVLSKDE